MTRTLFVLALFACAGMAGAAEHKVVEGEHMWKLAKQYYGDPYKWRTIAGANPGVNDPNRIYPMQVLIIPDIAAAPAPAPAAEPVPPPVEAGLAVSGADSAEMQAAEAKGLEVAQAPAPEPAPVEAKAPEPEMPAYSDDDSDGLSVKMPESLAGQYPSMSRLSVAKAWKADGIVTGMDDREVMAAQGDYIEAKLAGGVSVAKGDHFYVLRSEAAEEGESEKDARYLVRVGVLKAESDLGKGRWRFLILKSGDSLQIDDMISRKAL